MNKLEIAKKAATIVVGMGATKIVGDIIKNNADPRHVGDTITIAAGSFVLGSMVADATRIYTNAKIDQAATWYNENFKTT